MDDELVPLCAMATRTACRQMAARHVKALQDSFEQACCLSAKHEWERNATAHAEIFNLLADVVADPLPAMLLSNAAARVYDLMVLAGPVADGIIISGRRRLLAVIRARDADGAALEMEQHLRVLLFMGRLAGSPARSIGVAV
jgi:DNA-binding FadR family transcriptional regulator